MDYMDYEKLMHMTCKQLLRRYHARLIKLVTQEGLIQYSIHGGVGSELTLSERLDEPIPSNFVLVKDGNGFNVRTLLEIVYNNKLILPPKANIKQVKASLGPASDAAQSLRDYKKRYQI